MSTQLLTALIAAGTPAELVAEVAQLAADVAVLKRNRAANAARQHRNRQAKAARGVTDSNVTSRYVTLHNVTPPMVSSTPPSFHPQSSKPKRVSRSAAATALSDDWTLPGEFRTYARSKGWDDRKCDLEAERFKNHADAGGRTAKNWFAAWRNWVTSPYQTVALKGKANGKRSPIMEACDDLIARAENWAGGEIEGNPTIIDITPAGSEGR